MLAFGRATAKSNCLGSLKGATVSGKPAIVVRVADDEGLRQIPILIGQKKLATNGV